jgi:nicotinate-nucleotide pyrophosphorylase (carboxylating)
LQLLNTYVDDLIKRALYEDMSYLDLATDFLIDDNQTSSAYMIAKDTGVVSGIKIAMRVFEILDPSFNCEVFKNDGESVFTGDIIAKFKGKTASLLKGERTALNILQHMSGIATAVNSMQTLCKGTKCRICETRKTLPGLRAIEKYAVLCGGGKNHRFSLSDAAMIKDNHIDAFGSLKAAVGALRENLGHMVKIEVEVRDKNELQEALECGCDVIMLDNMSPELMSECVKIVAGRAVLEASGNITSANIADVAKTGVDVISLGALTHSVKAFDISMKIEKGTIN